MEDSHPLKSLLQLQLASDQSTVLHLPYVLETISPEHFLPSSHTQKWAARINSLLHSKDAATRWSGLCIALQTAVYSRAMMMECAQSWIGVALPLLSKDEAVINVKAAIRLLRYIFSGALDVTEFQRQLCIPSVPKASIALISIAEKRSEQQLKLLALDSLTHLIPLYPTLHRSLNASLSLLTLRFLNGSSPKPTPAPLVEAASCLYSTLHVTGGKVGASNLWRKSLDDTLAFAWGAFLNMRKTYPSAGHNVSIFQPGPSTEDSNFSIPLALDRLRAAVRILRDLLRASTSRPVQIPVGPLVQLCLAMLRCIPEEKAVDHSDTAVRAMEVSVIPAIWTLGCDLISSLCGSLQFHLTPHVPQLASHLSYHLEQQRTSRQRLSFLKATMLLLESCPYLHDSILSSRLARAILPSVTVLLATQSQTQADSDSVTLKSKNKRGKKRARGYEGDEQLKASMEIMCPTAEEGEVLLVTLDALRLLMRNTQLVPAVHSMASRILLSIYLSLPLVQPSLISPDISLHGKLYLNVRNTCAEIAAGTSSTMSKSLGLVIGVMNPNYHSACGADVLRDVDLLLHPRVPPLIRPLPHVETLSLFREEESDEEANARNALGLSTALDTASLLPSRANDISNVPGLGDAHADRETRIATRSRTVEQPPAIHPAYEHQSTTLVPPIQSIAMPSNAASSAAANPISSTSGADVTAVNSNTALESSSIQQRQSPSQPQGSTSSSTGVPDFKNLPATAPALPAAVSAPFASTLVSSITPVPQGSEGMDQDEEDEPMPTIDMDSDSDG